MSPAWGGSGAFQRAALGLHYGCLHLIFNVWEETRVLPEDRQLLRCWIID